MNFWGNFDWCRGGYCSIEGEIGCRSSVEDQMDSFEVVAAFWELACWLVLFTIYVLLLDWVLLTLRGILVFLSQFLLITLPSFIEVINSYFCELECCPIQRRSSLWVSLHQERIACWFYWYHLHIFSFDWGGRFLC